MTVEHSGGGDPDRSLRLLWRDRHAEPEPARGRRPRLSLEVIVAAAIRIADADGLAAASMHRVAKELGAGTMTLYSYVPAKDELLDLMVDAVLCEYALPGPGEPRPECWRKQVELYSERTRQTYRCHPWLRQVSMTRPALGPGMVRRQEYLLSALAGIGLTHRQMAAAASSIATFVNSNAAVEADTAYLERVTGQSTDTWWHQRRSFWENYFDTEANPTIVEVWENEGFELGVREAAAEAYDFGLHRLLDGIEALVGRGKPGEGLPRAADQVP
ncbi:TetR/AcrR family transcriptional regulator C-terminal domain-containing protein [Amycolatopsis magusensis]|uniref:TetR/AcrR family transcriptional regulator C-terminal domain-containing protein n=1 Tax=Amycolatopsis magusensis TaxID=882444 RepID=UPI0037A72E7D